MNEQEIVNILEGLRLPIAVGPNEDLVAINKKTVAKTIMLKLKRGEAENGKY